MASYDFRTQRLFLDTPLAIGTRIALERAQANYLLNVLRLGEGAEILVFNGRDGEWRARISVEGRKSGSLLTLQQTRPQSPAPELVYLFAPLKHARLDYMAQKAVEMGAGRLQPVLTRRTQANRVNLDRMRANAIEAAEQCGILALPDVLPETRLGDAIAALPDETVLVFCDEDAPIADPVAALQAAPAGSLAVLIGPEGGFDPQERALLLERANTVRLALGPRILRADTAAVAALTLVQAVRGDWIG
ncbi:MAG: 16S rRNA (uracil1498-N3)-methyltransferase [Saliniramus fredricksonii]|uniref:Ribosomal RNA small subunit methyltransferase E n=1 Tax=Saliniramus fredricksonii TaxID=1653334 RepID=A0A0P7XQL0_9HYPH|nr:16S rRNA (uracil(1498)-N(3))-methyltransferase [Saliniramus fredricksonii]KPQ09861.1 MAG: 16S rRNA (uracil1498-N3)-methyltransferase [Saliniramus fredricksonii]SCC82178.1 16S rRNA (uracil1498-N3)-methyltransferase [Saliniramus fredricksonii]